MNISRIQQEDNLGCQIACAAMIVGCSYKEARDVIVPNWEAKSPPGSFLVHKFLENRGWQIVGHEDCFYPALRYRFKDEEFPWPPEPFSDLHLVSVVTQGEMGFRHAVLMLKDGTILDPANSSILTLKDYPLVEQISSVVKIL